MVRLDPMTANEFTRFLRAVDLEYGRARARADGLPLAEARRAGRRQTAELLPKGRTTPGHHLFTVREGGAAVGTLWLYISGEGRRRQAFVYDIMIGARHRGRGLGRATMLASELRAVELGARRIALNVFGYNASARALYESLGYRPTAIRMGKVLRRPARRSASPNQPR